MAIKDTYKELYLYASRLKPNRCQTIQVMSDRILETTKIHNLTNQPQPTKQQLEINKKLPRGFSQKIHRKSPHQTAGKHTWRTGLWAFQVMGLPGLLGSSGYGFEGFWVMGLRGSAGLRRKSRWTLPPKDRVTRVLRFGSRVVGLSSWVPPEIASKAPPKSTHRQNWPELASPASIHGGSGSISLNSPDLTLNLSALSVSSLCLDLTLCSQLSF